MLAMELLPFEISCVLLQFPVYMPRFLFAFMSPVRALPEALYLSVKLCGEIVRKEAPTVESIILQGVQLGYVPLQKGYLAQRSLLFCSYQ